MRFLRRGTSTLSPEVKQALQQADKQYRETLEGIKKQYQVPTPEPIVKPLKVDLGPLESVIVLWRGGEKSIEALPRRIMMEHVDIGARRLRESRRFRNMALWGFLGMLFGIPTGSVAGFVLLASGKMFFSAVATLLICFFLGLVSGIIPGLVLGWRRQEKATWFVRRDGEHVWPLEYEVFDQSRFQGHVTISRDEKGQVHIEVPAGVKAQSASFMYHACRSDDWKGLWKGGSSSWAKYRTVGIIVIAICVLFVTFIVGYTSISGDGDEVSPKPGPSGMIGGANG